MAHGVTIGAEGDEVVGAVAPTLTAGDVVVDLEEPRGIAEGAAVTVASVDAAHEWRSRCLHSWLVAPFVAQAFRLAPRCRGPVKGGRLRPFTKPLAGAP